MKTRRDDHSGPGGRGGAAWLFSVTVRVVLGAGALALLIAAGSVPLSAQWHTAVWPASNMPPSLPPLGYDVTNSVTTNVVGGVTNVSVVLERVVTNLYRGAGTFSQLTNCVYTNWFIWGTNWFQLYTNCLIGTGGLTCITGSTTNEGGVLATNWLGLSKLKPPKATSGVQVTNWLGVTGTRPGSNRCATVLWTPPVPFGTISAVVCVDPVGGVEYSSNTWTREVVVSEVSDEPFRWAFLRGRDVGEYGDPDYMTWRERTIAGVWNADGDPKQPANFPLYHYAEISTNGGISYNATNLFVSSPLLTNRWKDRDGRFQQWQYPFVADTNRLANVEDLQMIDLWGALMERVRVVPDGVIYGWYPNIYNTNPYLDFRNAWRLGSEPSRVTGDLTALGRYGRGNVATAKALTLRLAPNFLIRGLSTNGDFTAHLSKPSTLWTWGTDTNGVDRWLSTVGYTNTFPMWDNEVNLLEGLPLPHGWLTATVTTNLVMPGWKTGSYYQFEVTNMGVSVTLSNLYGSYFAYTPEKRFTPGFPGQGHLVTGTWNFVDAWLVVSNIPVSLGVRDQVKHTYNVSTNSMLLPCRTAMTLPGGIFVTDTVFSVVSAPLTCLATNYFFVVTNCYSFPTGTVVCASSTNSWNTNGVFNGVIATNQVGPTCAIVSNATFTRTAGTNVASTRVEVYHRKYRNGLFSDRLAFSTNLTSPINDFWVTTNALLVLTNYDVAAGWHEIDYGPDGVRTTLNEFTWQTLDLASYASNYVQPLRWAVTNTVNAGKIGVWRATNCLYVTEDVIHSRWVTNDWGIADSETRFHLHPGDGWPLGARSVSTGPAKALVFTQTVTVVDNGATTVSESEIEFWPGCVPANFSASSSYAIGPCPSTIVDYSVNYSFTAVGTREDAVDANGCYVGFINNLQAAAGCTPSLSSVGSVTAVSLHGLASVLAYPEAYTNQLSGRELYVMTGPAASTRHLGFEINTNRQVGVIATNIDEVAGSGCLASHTYVKYVNWGGWSYTTGPDAADCFGFPEGFTNFFGDSMTFAPATPAEITACSDSVVNDSIGAIVLGFNPGLEIEVTTADEPSHHFLPCSAAWGALTTDTTTENCTFGSATKTITTWCYENYVEIGTRVPDSLYHTASYNSIFHLVPKPSVENYWTPACRQTVTNFDVPLYASEPIWDGSEFGLHYDSTNAAGWWQRMGTNAAGFPMDIGFTNFATGAAPWHGITITPEFIRGWSISAGKALLKWDQGTNGFRYRCAPSYYKSCAPRGPLPSSGCAGGAGRDGWRRW